MTTTAHTPPPRNKIQERFGSLLEVTCSEGILQARVHRLAKGVDLAQDDNLLAVVWGQPRFLSASMRAPKAFSLLEAYRRTGQFVAGQLREGFAFLLWDGERQRLILATDRLARRKLYVAFTSLGGDGKAWRLTISDKPKTLAKAIRATWSTKALRIFMEIGRIPAPLTAWEGIEVLEAGCNRLYENGQWQKSSCWQPRFAYLDDGDATPHAEEFEANLRQLVRNWKKDEALFWVDGTLSNQLALQWMYEAGCRKPSTFSMTDKQGPASKAEKACIDYYYCHHNRISLTAESLLMQLDRLAHAFDQPVADLNALQALIAQGLSECSGRPLASTFALKYLLMDDPVGHKALSSENRLLHLTSWLKKQDDKQTITARAKRYLDELHADTGRSPESYAWLLEHASEVLGRPRTHAAVNQFGYLAWHWQLADAVFMSTQVADNLCDSEEKAGWGPLNDKWLAWSVELPPQLKWRSGQGEALIRDRFVKRMPFSPKRWKPMAWPSLELPKEGANKPEWMQRLEVIRSLGLLNDKSANSGKVASRASASQVERIWRGLFLSAWIHQNAT